MSYNQQQQGFNMNPGGVPHNNTPSYPNAPVGEVMQPYLATMSAKLYNDMASRGTQYTNAIAQEYSRNGYINNLFEDALVILANYVEYMMSTSNRQFSELIDNAVSDCNSALLENQHRSNHKLNQIQLFEDEKIRYRAAKSKMDSLRMKISSFLTSKGQNMNQPYPQQAPQGYQQPNQQQPNFNQGYQQPPQQQNMSPQQWQAYQNQMQQAAMYAQQQQNNNMSPQQWQAYQQPYPQQAPQGYQQPNQQTRGNDFVNRVHQRMNQHPQFNNSPFNGQPQFNQQQGYPQQGYQQPNQQQPNFNQGYNPQPTFNQGYQQAPQGYQQPNQHGGFAVNSNTAQQYQQPPRSASIYKSTYDPMPTVDESKLNTNPQQTNVSRTDNDPFAHNAQFMKQRVADTTPTQSNSFTQGASFSQPTQPNPSTSDIAKYQQRVKTKAAELGIPSGLSISYLEAAIVQLDPKNGFISPKNAYSEVQGFKNTSEPSGLYDGKQDLSDVEEINVYTGGEAMLQNVSKSFASQMLDSDVEADAWRARMAAESRGDLVKQPKGNYAWMNENYVKQFKEEYPGVDPTSLDHAVLKSNPPYDFAYMNGMNQWVVDAEHFSKLNKTGWGHVEAIHPVYSTTGHYVVDDDGLINGFFSKPFNANIVTKERNMDYAQHDDSRFFVPLSQMDKDSVPDEKAMLATFAKLQVQQKVADIVKELENEAGVIDGEVGKLVITESVVVDGQVNGNIAGDDYYGMAYTILADSMGDIDYSYTDISIRYRHVTMYPWLTEEADKDILRKLRYKTDYLEIAEVLNNMSKYAVIPQSWFTQLNAVATKYVNHLVATRYALADNDLFHIDSFCLDIQSVIIEMTKLGHGDDFIQTAKRLSDAMLYVWDMSNPVFENHMTRNGEEVVDDETVVVGCGIVRDVTAIPLHSRDVPLHSSKDVCILTQGGFEDLWNVAKDRIENRDNRTSEIVIVTSDNRPMYINETVNPDIFAITKKSLFD